MLGSVINKSCTLRSKYLGVFQYWSKLGTCEKLMSLEQKSLSLSMVLTLEIYS